LEEELMLQILQLDNKNLGLLRGAELKEGRIYKLYWFVAAVDLTQVGTLSSVRGRLN
jgi:hypothetical protein